jgi:hypothetical protein
MPSVPNKRFVLNVIMLHVITLSVVALYIRVSSGKQTSIRGESLESMLKSFFFKTTKLECFISASNLV